MNWTFTLVGHVRYASTGAHPVSNSHPVTDGRLFAHNGTFGGLELLDARLDELGAEKVVAGQTDSERMFALITAESARSGGNVPAAIVSAVSWIADTVPVFALNLILAHPEDLWALRYPAAHELYVLDRRSVDGPSDTAPLHLRTARIRTLSDELSGTGSVVLASEPMDGENGWRLMDPGELVHVGTDLSMTSTAALPTAPRFPLTLADLSPTAAASQGVSAQKTPA